MKPTATVDVYDPCHCLNCKAGKRWFSCSGSIPDGPTDAYDCEIFDDMPGVPDPRQVVLIERAHPGKDLVYIDGGEYYRALLVKYRQTMP